VQVPSGPPFFTECSSVFRAPGLGPGGRRRKSCHSDHFYAAVAEPIRHPSSKRIDAGENPAGSAILLPGGVKVARRPVKPLVLVRVQVWQPFIRKAGRYKLAAPVPKTGSAQTRGRSVTDAFRHLNLNERKIHETRSPLSKPIALSQELQAATCHSYPAHREAESCVPSGAPVRHETATDDRPVAQEQSARLITGRPRSITARDEFQLVN
jgi:hypothetical protein